MNRFTFLALLMTLGCTGTGGGEGIDGGADIPPGIDVAQDASVEAVEGVDASSDILVDTLADVSSETATPCDPAERIDLCCCDMDRGQALVCEDGAWICPNGFERFSGTDCSDPCGPCSHGCWDVLTDVSEDIQPDALPDVLPDIPLPEDTALPDTAHPEGVQSLTYTKSGGFAGWSYETILTGGSMTFTFNNQVCVGALTPAQLQAIEDAAMAVDWSTVGASYILPNNPFCCCDQFVYVLDVGLDFPGEPVSVSTTWCDEAMFGGGLPAAVADFAAAVEVVAGQIPCN